MRRFAIFTTVVVFSGLAFCIGYGILEMIREKDGVTPGSMSPEYAAEESTYTNVFGDERIYSFEDDPNTHLCSHICAELKQHSTNTIYIGYTIDEIPHFVECRCDKWLLYHE